MAFVSATVGQPTTPRTRPSWRRFRGDPGETNNAKEPNHPANYRARDDLADKLQIVGRGVSTRTSVQILAGMDLVTDIAACILIGIEDRLPAFVEARQLYEDLLAAAPADSVR